MMVLTLVSLVHRRNKHLLYNLLALVHTSHHSQNENLNPLKFDLVELCPLLSALLSTLLSALS